MQIVSAAGITKVYGKRPAEVHALRGVDLHLQKGEFVSIMGPSGSGKSTLLAIVGGLDSSTYGQVSIGSRPWWS